MRDLDKLVDRISSLEDTLEQYANALAAELDKPVSKRDITACREKWDDIISFRPKLKKAFKDFASLPDEVQKPKGAKSREAKKKKSFINLARKRYNSWSRIEALIQAQCNPAPSSIRCLRPQPTTPETLNDAVNTLFVESFHKFANPNFQGQDGSDYGCFADIPLPMQYFSMLIGVAYKICLAQKRERPLRFLDVGSGGGTKVLAATTCFDICHGLEYDKAYADAGEHMLNCVMPERCTNIHGDGLTFEHYSDYDVIYFYRPMRDGALLRQLEQQIIRTSRPGTVLIAPYDIIRENADDFGCVEVSDSVFVTGISIEEADALHKEASYIGDAVVPVLNLDRERVGCWLELLRVSVGNGFSL